MVPLGALRHLTTAITRGLTISWSEFLRAKHGFGQVKSVSWGALAPQDLRCQEVSVVSAELLFFGLNHGLPYVTTPSLGHKMVVEGCDSVGSDASGGWQFHLSGTAPAAWTQYFSLMRWWTPCSHRSKHGATRVLGVRARVALRGPHEPSPNASHAFFKLALQSWKATKTA